MGLPVPWVPLSGGRQGAKRTGKHGPRAGGAGGDGKSRGNGESRGGGGGGGTVNLSRRHSPSARPRDVRGEEEGGGPRGVGGGGDRAGDADHLADVFSQRHTRLRGHVHLHAAVLALEDVDGQAVFLERRLAQRSPRTPLGRVGDGAAGGGCDGGGSRCSRGR